MEIANLVAAVALCGLIWTIQLVHYPLFALVGEAQWVAYGEAHRRRITALVLPLMSANVILAAGLVVREQDALRVANVAIAGGGHLRLSVNRLTRISTETRC